MNERPAIIRSTAPAGQPEVVLDSQAEQAVVPYDENLLDRARTQWHFGDWRSLCELDRETLQHHPERAKLALLAAAARLQSDDATEARQLVRSAHDWGCNKKLIARILAAGVHNSLGRAAALSGNQSRAVEHFRSAIAVGNPGGDARLLAQARIGEQMAQLGFAGGNPVGSLKVEVSAANTGAKVSQASHTLKEEITAAIHAEIRANNPNPYGHNRTLTPALNKALRDFGERVLAREGLRPAYVDYLGGKTIQLERTCVGRLATTVQDAIARQLIAECVPGDRICILEIGALYGVSLAILYDHAVTRFSEVKVVCLDPFDGYYGKALDAVLNQPVNDLTFRRNMRLANVPDSDYSIIKHYSTSPEALAAARKLAVNLLIIDGDHSYEGVKFDFDSYFPLLQPGGYVIFDDYNAKEWPGVQKFIDQDVQQAAGFEYLGFISRTAVGRKRIDE